MAKKKSKSKKKKKKPASKRRDAAISQRAVKPVKSKPVSKKVLGHGKNENLAAAFAAVSTCDVKAALELLGKVTVSDKTVQGKVRDAVAALKAGSVLRARVLLGQAQQVLASI